MPRERRYLSDLTDAQWAPIGPLLPTPNTDGRPKKHPRRDIMVEWSQRILQTMLHVVRKAPGQIGFAVIKRRWVVERSPAWLTSHRRLARDYERQPATAEAMIRWAAISGMARRLTRGSAATRQQRLALTRPTE
ncbi:hypothetical protein ACWENQ_45155 [Nonomuraea sp. NPDC004354]